MHVVICDKFVITYVQSRGTDNVKREYRRRKEKQVHKTQLERLRNINTGVISDTTKRYGRVRKSSTKCTVIYIVTRCIAHKQNIFGDVITAYEYSLLSKTESNESNVLVLNTHLSLRL